MSFLIASPETVATAASDLSGIGSAIRAANFTAALSTTSVVGGAQDEVSAAVSALFSNYGQEYQALSARAERTYRAKAEELQAKESALSLKMASEDATPR